MFEKFPSHLERNLFWIFTVTGIVIVAGAACYEYFIGLDHWESNCELLRLAGFYCPGCGGSRAVLNLVQGNLLKSFYYHPFVPYAAIVYLCFFAGWILERLTKGRIKRLNLCAVYFYLAIIIIVLTCIGKNLPVFLNGDHFW